MNRKRWIKITIGSFLVLAVFRSFWSTPESLWETVCQVPPPPSVHLIRAERQVVDWEMLHRKWAVFFQFEADQAYVDLQASHPRSPQTIQSLNLSFPDWFEPKYDPVRYEILDYSNESGRYYLFMKQGTPRYSCYLALSP
jgi:hypothetical protein